MRVQIFTAKKDIGELWERLFPGVELPGPLLSQGRRPIAAGFFREEELTGGMFGELCPESSLCRIHTFLLRRENAGRRAAVRFLDEALCRLKYRHSVKKVQFSLI